MVNDWGHEYPIVFVGHSLQDADIRLALLELTKLGEFRPRYYLVKPSIDESERRLWEGKRISVLEGTLEEFLTSLDSGVPPSFRTLLSPASVDHPIAHGFAATGSMSGACRDFLDADVEFIHSSMAISTGTPQAFYKGFDLEWYGIVQQLDIRRYLTDEILFDWLLISDSERPTTVELLVIKAEAGAGKSVLLRRLAWEAGVEGELLCLYLREYGQLRYDSVRELHRLTGERVFLFVDNAADHVTELADLLGRARSENLPLTVISAERLNTWNTSCERLEPHLTEAFLLRNLNRGDVERLVDTLAKHGSLGYLKDLPREAQIAAFVERAGRQLLVALHEATSGRPFEDILVDEYNEIHPREAQALYLSVCVLNRLGIPVRAGIIARVHQIPFTQFRERLFAPLEHVVRVVEHPLTKDYLYTARHSEIAAIVFDRILTSPTQRYNEYVSLLSALNLSYSTDYQAYRSLIRGRSLLDLFPSHEAAEGIFDVAAKVAGDDSYWLQQRGIYEMHRPNGSLKEAHRLLSEARSTNPRDMSIVHSLAELARLQGERADSQVNRERYRLEAAKLALSLLHDEGSKEYGLHTLVKMEVQELKESLQRPDLTDKHIDRLVEKIEEHLEAGLQEYPNSSYLLSSEADFGTLINDHGRAKSALERAFEANRRNALIGIRLARIHEGQGDLAKANSVLKAALDAKPGDKGLHFRYAMLLKRQGQSDLDTLLYHLRRGFTQWDTNYDAQFWFARYAFEAKDEETRRLGKEVFKRLRNTPLKHDLRVQIRSHLEEGGTTKTFTGSIVRRQETNGFVEMDGRGEWIFFHLNDQGADVWESLREGKRVTFQVGFSFGGPLAAQMELS